MRKDINFVPLYSVGRIVQSKEGKAISCAFCEKEMKVSQKEMVVYQGSSDGFYHVDCYKDWQKKRLNGEIFESHYSEPKRLFNANIVKKTINKGEGDSRTRLQRVYDEIHGRTYN